MRLLSVNIGGLRAVDFEGARIVTAIYKLPIEGRRSVGRLGVDGDVQADQAHHGGPERAVYAYSVEDYRWFGEPFTPGKFGENLTIEGLESASACLGDRLHIGGVVLEVSAPRIPCRKLAIKLGEVAFVQRFWASRRFGFYLRVVEEGELGAGDEVRYVRREPRGMTIAAAAQAHFDAKIANEKGR
jgi:MOSC domain-containing protein YiiM